jgi:hypothetical protein
MRVTYYSLPQSLPAREQYRILKAEGYCNRPEPPKELTDEQILKDMGVYHMCKLREAKRLLKKYGGYARTEWYDRDGSFVDVSDIDLDGRNSGSYRSA